LPAARRQNYGQASRFVCGPPSARSRRDGWGNSGQAAYAGYPDYYFSWSVLAQMNPYLEQTAISNQMDLKQSIYKPPTYNVTATKQFALQQTIKLFLCPSDKGQPVSVASGEPVIGPTNYAVCRGSGTTNGAAPSKRTACSRPCSPVGSRTWPC
jgi:Protein of unknown function (DUF1559)